MATARTFQFDADTVVEKFNQILQMELAAVIYYTEHSLMILRSRADSDRSSIYIIVRHSSD
jgi:bacterioferritin (cytochrome b1)